MSTWRRPLVQALAVVALILAGVLAWLLSGVGSTPQWPSIAAPVASGGRTDSPGLPPPTPLEQVADAWRAPLFSPRREPDRAVQAAKASLDLGGLRLTGVVIDGDLRLALFKQADGRDISLREGSRMSIGWRLQRIEAQAVQLELDGQTRRLQLPSPRLPNMKVPAPASSILIDRPAPSQPAPGGH